MKLGVNVDHVATLRQARLPYAWQNVAQFTDPLMAAKLCERCGAHSVVMHLREDRRHIQDSDILRAKKELSIKLNLEMSIAPDVVKVALKVKPDQVTLVPEKRLERTTEGGLDLLKNGQAVRRVVDAMKTKGIVSSLFIDPDARQVEAAKKAGAEAVEFHTGDYANQRSPKKRAYELKRLKDAVILARSMRLSSHAGHGLDYENVKPLRDIRGLDELNIGYSIVTRALWVGFERAIHEMLELIRG